MLATCHAVSEAGSVSESASCHDATNPSSACLVSRSQVHPSHARSPRLQLVYEASPENTPLPASVFRNTTEPPPLQLRAPVHVLTPKWSGTVAPLGPLYAVRPQLNRLPPGEMRA